MTIAAELARQSGARLRWYLQIDGIKDRFWSGGDALGADGADVDCDPPGGHPLLPDTIALWRLDEVAASLDAVDELGQLDGTAVGSPGVVTGKIDGGRGDFTAADRFDVTTTTEFNVQRFTIGAWVKWSAEEGPPPRVIIRKKRSTGFSWTLQGIGDLGRNPEIRIRFTDATEIAVFQGSDVAIGVWTHLLATWDGTTLRLYVNGLEVGTPATASKTIDYTTTDLVVIGRDAAAEFFLGSLDDVVVYGRAYGAEWARRAGENGNFSRPGIRCLMLPENEFSHGLDLKRMVVNASTVRFQLVNVPDPRDRSTPTKHYFAKLFAPGRPSQPGVKRTTIRRLNAGDKQIDANATTIPVQNLSGWPTAGIAHIGAESFSYTGTATPTQTGFQTNQTIAQFTGVTKGIYPALRSANRGRTIPHPRVNDENEGDVGAYHVVAQQPYTIIGREIGLYVTAWDPANGKWFSEGTLFWAGQITEDISYDPSTDTWNLTAQSILKMLEREVATHFPIATLDGGINLNGDFGRKWTVAEYDANGVETGRRNCEIAKGYYDIEKLKRAIVDEMNTQAWSGTFVHSFVSFEADSDGALSVKVTHTNTKDKYSWRFFFHDNTGSSGNKLDYCHAWQALGFDITAAPRARFEIPSGSAAAVAVMPATQKPWHHYQPVRLEYNGAKMRVFERDNDKLWTDQGDYGNALAWLVAKKQPVRGLNAETDLWVGSYTAKTAVSDYTELTMGGPAAILVNHDGSPLDALGFIGSGQDEAPLEVRQVYIPSYVPSGQGFRGPLEILLYSLLSSGTNNYNDSTYDKLELPMSVDFPTELIDTAGIVIMDALLKSAHADLAKRPFYLIDKPVKWIDLWAREAQLWGVFLAWENGKLVIRSAITPAYHLQEITLDESTRALRDDYPAVSLGTRNVINQWEVHAYHDLAKNKARIVATFNDPESQQGIGAVHKLVIKHPGLKPGFESGKPGNIEQLLALLFADRAKLYRHPHQFIRVSLAPKLINDLFVGEAAQVAHGFKHPDPLGSGKMTATIKAMTTNVAWSLKSRAGSADVIIFGAYDPADIVPWAAAAQFDNSAANGGWDATTHFITTIALQYGAAGDADDGSAFEMDDELWIIEDSEDPTAPTLWGPIGVASPYETDGPQILSMNGIVLTGYDATKDHWVVPADYLDAVAAQRTRNLYQADKGTHLLGGTDEAHRWG